MTQASAKALAGLTLGIVAMVMVTAVILLCRRYARARAVQGAAAPAGAAGIAGTVQAGTRGPRSDAPEHGAGASSCTWLQASVDGPTPAPASRSQQPVLVLHPAANPRAPVMDLAVRRSPSRPVPPASVTELSMFP